ncbi:MAG: hypothetical protein WCR27_08165 [Eubacteriales bacterium]
MSEKDNTQQTTQSQTKITADIFVKPTMSTETRGEQGSIHMQTLHDGLSMREMTFAKDKDDQSKK